MNQLYRISLFVVVIYVFIGVFDEDPSRNSCRSEDAQFQSAL